MKEMNQTKPQEQKRSAVNRQTSYLTTRLSLVLVTAVRAEQGDSIVRSRAPTHRLKQKDPRYFPGPGQLRLDRNSCRSWGTCLVRIPVPVKRMARMGWQKLER